jgi:hypothetical protein
MSGARVRAFAVACGLITLLGTGAPAQALKPPTVPLSIVVNTITASSNMDPDRCTVSANLTASGFKGRAPSVWVLRPGVSPVNLGAAVKGVATDYSVGVLPKETINPLAFELRDNKGRMLARDEETPTIACAPALEIISIDSVPFPGRTDLCALPVTWQPNLLPEGATSWSVIRRIHDNANAWSGIATVTADDIGVSRTEQVGSGFAIGREVDSGSYTMWLEYVEFSTAGTVIVRGTSNSMSVNATCPST